jgi:tRNA (mo5U34)-methyltransferase
VRLSFLKRKLTAPAAPPSVGPPVPPSPVTDPAERDRLQSLVKSCIFWWHSLDLGQGVVTPGHKTPEVLRVELEAQRWPELRGKAVLDIGAWDGFFSFEAERRGAGRVVALDHYVWSLDHARTGPYCQKCRDEGVPVRPFHTVPGLYRPDTLPGKRGFDVAREVLRSKVEPVVGDFMEMDLAPLGTFDVVLFLGVLYHMPHPLAALERVCRLTRELAVIETEALALPGFEERAVCEFFEGDELGADPTNWWVPNAKALAGLCRAAGFRRAEVLTVAPRARFPRPGQVLRYRALAHAWK